MNLFNLFKRIFNIGGPQIDLVIQESIYYPADLIRGELLITAPEYGQNIRSITLSLKEFWVEYSIRGGTDVGIRADRYREYDSATLAKDFVFYPGMQYRFPFEIRLPANCRVSSEESGWRLGVVINTFRQFASRADFDVNVQLSKTLQTIIEDIETSTKFVEVPRGRKYIPDLSAMRFIFRPPEHLQPGLQYLELDLSLTEEGGIKGSILYRMNENSSFSQFISNSVDAGVVTNAISDKLMEFLSSKSH